MSQQKSKLFVAALLLSASLSVAAQAKASPAANSACTEDSCQACATGGTCMLNLLAQCRDPACVLLGVGGGILGAVGGGIVGPMVLTLPGMVAYPGVDPSVALFGAILAGAGIGCVVGGVPGMACGSMIGGGWATQSCIPNPVQGCLPGAGPKKNGFKPKKKRRKRPRKKPRR